MKNNALTNVAGMMS